MGVRKPVFGGWRRACLQIAATTAAGELHYTARLVRLHVLYDTFVRVRLARKSRVASRSVNLKVEKFRIM